MKTTVLISALATGAYAWTYPDCEHDGCYRNLVDPRYSDQAPAFCIAWISGTTTDASAIPTQYRNCLGVAPLSSVCSCIAYTATITDCITETATNTPSPVTTSSQSQITVSTPPVTPTLESTTECATMTESSTSSLMTTSKIPISTTAYPVSSNNASTSVATSSPAESSFVGFQPSPSKTLPWTTSTIFTTSTHIITKCPLQATNCPDESTVVLTSIVPVSTTVCPVLSTESPPLPLQSSKQELLPQSSSEAPPPSSFVSERPLFQPSIHASHTPSQSFGCRFGQKAGPDGDCSSVTSFFPHRPPPPLASGLPIVSGSSTPPVSTAGTAHLGIEAAVVVVGVVAALFQVV